MSPSCTEQLLEKVFMKSMRTCYVYEGFNFLLIIMKCAVRVKTSPNYLLANLTSNHLGLLLYTFIYPMGDAW